MHIRDDYRPLIKEGTKSKRPYLLEQRRSAGDCLKAVSVMSEATGIFLCLALLTLIIGEGHVYVW